MRLQFITQRISASGTVNFNFSDSVQSYFAGVTGFCAWYSSDSMQTRRIGVVLNAAKSGDSLIQVQLDLSLDGTLLNSSGFAWVTVVAWTGNEGGAYLTSVDGLNVTTMRIIAPATPIFTHAALASFEVGFTVNETVTGVNAEVAAHAMGSRISVSGSAQLVDREGQPSACSALSAGVISALDPAVPFGIRTASVSTAGHLDDTSMTVDFDRNVTRAVAIMTSLEMSGLPLMWTSQGDRAPLRVIVAGAMKHFGGNYSPMTGIIGNRVTTWANVSMYSTIMPFPSPSNNAQFMIIGSHEPWHGSEPEPEPLPEILVPPPPVGEADQADDADEVDQND